MLAASRVAPALLILPYNSYVALIALFPLDVVLLPGAPLPLHIFEPRYKEMVSEALLDQKPFGIVRAQENSIAEIGCVADVTEVVKKYEDGKMDILTEGAKRFQIVQLIQESELLRAEVNYFEYKEEQPAPRPEADKLFELNGQL